MAKLWHTTTATRYEGGKSFWQLCIFKVWRWDWLKSVVLNLEEEIVKVQSIEMRPNGGENQNGQLPAGLRVCVQEGFLCI